ncbi:MAG: RNA 2',3'-cyclic phosphodiesterase [Candidatus Eisenbacteria sp.]|nr:RNA 2',3'-cyclic phosphodiesterase [Candidatus Eisenbacteria bacterium]
MIEKTRAFLAVALPESAIHTAEDVLASLRARLETGEVKWVVPENLHITLRFFGGLLPEELARARAFVQALDGGFDRVESAWLGLGAFPSERRVQVIWMGLADAGGRFKAVAREVNQKLIRQGFGRPDKPFRTHVTLGRVRRGRRVSWPQISGHLTIPDRAFSISTIALIKSDLTPQGPVYTPLETACARP